MQLQTIVAKSIDVKFMMGKVEDDVETTLRHWRSQPAVPGADAIVVDDQLVFVDNTIYLSSQSP